MSKSATYAHNQSKPRGVGYFVKSGFQTGLNLPPTGGHSTWPSVSRHQKLLEICILRIPTPRQLWTMEKDLESLEAGNLALSVLTLAVILDPSDCISSRFEASYLGILYMIFRGPSRRRTGCHNCTSMIHKIWSAQKFRCYRIQTLSFIAPLC